MLKLMKIWNRDLDLNIQKSFSWIYLNTRSVTRYLCWLNLFGIHSWKSIWPWRPVSDRCRWRNWAHWPFIYEKRFQASSNESNKIHFYNCLVLVFIKLSFFPPFWDLCLKYRPTQFKKYEEKRFGVVSKKNSYLSD